MGWQVGGQACRLADKQTGRQAAGKQTETGRDRQACLHTYMHTCAYAYMQSGI